MTTVRTAPPDLPGIPVGPHDTISVSEFVASRGRTPQDRMLWWHHADRDVPHPTGHVLRRVKGGLCSGGSPGNHTIVSGGPDDIEHLTLRASLLCGDCGRHGWITDGKWSDA